MGNADSSAVTAKWWPLVAVIEVGVVIAVVVVTVIVIAAVLVVLMIWWWSQLWQRLSKQS